ncbi:hypothetical protein V494_05827 [Pseudogymnoascus sp. VKM F-4513 (FW-928)]|nr:hypothetical protein V494_05827 [Pseudogymnoascus sp. VKM F-4513 (FW-928)]
MPPSTPTQDRLSPPIACLRQRRIAAPDAAVPITDALPAANTASSPRSVAGRLMLGAWSPARRTRRTVHSLGAVGAAWVGLAGKWREWLLVVFGSWTLE